METMYKVFTRTWWKANNSGQWPDNLEPHMGRKTTLAKRVTREEALRICKAYNDTHKPGKFSRKAEFQAL
jgi:molybdopterin-guanine dinucleotide biosynthesis protein